MNVNYYLMQPNRLGLYSVVLYATQDGVQFRYNTRIKLADKQWSKKKQMCTDVSIATDVNATLSSIRNMAMQYFATNDEVTRQGLISFLDIKLKRKTQAKVKTFWELIDDFMLGVNERTNGNGERISEHRVKLYRHFITTLKEFEKTRMEKLSFSNFDEECIADFKTFLVERYNLAPNTLAGRNRLMRTIFAAIEKKGVDVNQAYKQSRCKQVKTEHIVFDEQELQQIYDYDCGGNSRLQNVKDLLIIGTTTGLRFSDYSRVKPEHIVDGKITIHQQKTGSKVTIPVHPILKRMIDERGLPHTISCAKFNVYLRELCRLAGITTPVEIKKVVGGKRIVEFRPKCELVSSHICRRTFATNLYIKGINPKIIMLLTGHTQLATFMNYIVLDGDSVYNVVKDIWSDAI